MIWPSSSPYALELPPVPPSAKGGLASDPEKDDIILAVGTSKPGYVVAVITWRGLYLFRPKPFCPVGIHVRSEKSIADHGSNVSLLIRPDGQKIAVTTTNGSIFVYHIYSSFDSAEVCQLSGSFLSEEHGMEVFPGPGEGAGVRELQVRFKLVLKVASGISRAIALEDDILVVTKDPEAIQLVKWTAADQASVESQNRTILWGKLKWLNDPSDIHDMTLSKAMLLFGIVTESSCVYTATLDSSEVELKGHLIHKPSQNSDPKRRKDDEAIAVAINARFSVVAVGCKRGTIFLYNIKDYHGTVKLITTFEPPSSSFGGILTMKWSPDGYGLFVGYESGWGLYSVYGMLNASSFLSNQEQKEKEAWLDGISIATWQYSGDVVLIVAKNAPNKIWAMSILKWSAMGNYINENLNKPILYTDTKMIIYRGHDQNDLTTIDRDALLWLHVTFPPGYVAENWPIRFVTTSSDGRYVAVAGVRGLCHYSVHSGRWKLFEEDYMDREFSVRGGMVWFGHILIAGVETESSHELRLYSRDLDLEPRNMLFAAELPSTILKLCLVGNVLLVYTFDNLLYIYRIRHNSEEEEDPMYPAITLELEREVSFSEIVSSPARVRSLTCLAQQLDSSSAMPILMLVDGVLVLLEPTEPESETDAITYSKRVLHEHIEFCNVSENSDSEKQYYSLWAFDGTDMLVWLRNLEGLPDVDHAPTTVPIESYPLAVLLNKGLIVGLEGEAMLPREATFTYFKHWTSAQLFVPFLLESYLRMGQEDRALKVATNYKHLKYFAHILEMMLYKVLDDEAHEKGLESELLAKASRLLQRFPQMLDVVVGCTRKTEVSYWKKLFHSVGSPQALFDRCLTLGKLRTAGGYLLVLHNLDSSNQTQNTINLFKSAYESGDWEFCEELARFLTAIDPSATTLKETLDNIGLSPIYN
ncbi:hypothetical protein TRVA0_041S00452 [Trichomonascus vanleenenianus]|uniref:RIC1 family protein n=1 Tax=Trichomonascus vanleenenianus TaxID=2268995 RepID=UPI003ECA5447